MLSRLVLSFVPLVSLGQTSDTAQQRVIEELRGVRTTLERLEKSNAILVSLVKIQIDESRLAALEAQRQRLVAQEQDLSNEIGKTGPAVLHEDANSGRRLVQSANGSEPEFRTAPSPAKIRHTEATRRIEEVRRGIRTLEQSMTELRNRIAVVEKHLENAGR